MIFNLNRSVLSIVALLLATAANPAQAQITLTPGNDTGTVLTPNGGAIDISGSAAGTAVNNLFHSFQKFGLNAGQTANFLADPSIKNILSRVVGGDPSVINGLIRITSTDPTKPSQANLFLMNPAGIIFGSGAELDVRGSFIATTANGIGFGTDKWFNAVGTNTYADLLGNPTSLAFTMSQPGAIVNAGTLSVSSGSTLVLAGGTVVSSAPIVSQSGITIMAVPGRNLVRISQTGNILSLEIPVAIGANSPTALPSNFSILSLPQLLTGGNAGTANGLTVDSNGQVTLTSSSVPVKTGDLVTSNISGLGNLSTIRPEGSNPVTLFAMASVSTGDINTLKLGSEFTGGSVLVDAGNSISIGNIYTGFRANSVDLSAGTGNITVSSIRAGGSGINITTPGTFRATRPDPISTDSLRQTSAPSLVIKDNPDLINFLVSQGIPREQLINSTSEVPLSARAEGNVVALGSNSVIRIQHGGDAAISSDANRGGSLQSPLISIGTAPNTTNPVPFVTGGFDGFTSRENIRSAFDPSLARQSFTVDRIYRRPNQFPEGVSGSAVGIYVGNTDAQLYGSLQSRPFVPPPIVTPPVAPPEPPVIPGEPPVIQNPIQFDPSGIQPIQTSATQTQASTGDPAGGKTGTEPASTQRPQVDRTSNSPCTSTSTDKPSELGSRDRRNNPCTLNPQDDAQILKILDEPLTPQGKEITPLPKQVSWWRLGNDR